ncbi:MAG TPA: 2-hydroxyacid dehydrogenase [Bacteroidota bacterium]|nr:2-hydroxyacid dehydrogenase [Bacteroidota bacterium]HRT68120.1 2-hydroxyacid dehydrogenase [Bacteroidota bacterium]
MKNLIVTYKTTQEEKNFLLKFFSEQINDKEITIEFLQDHPEQHRGDLLRNSNIILAWNPKAEGLISQDIKYDNLEFIQLLSAGYDHINLNLLPINVKVAANQGAYAEPMAEHTVAMLLSCAKRLNKYQNLMKQGIFRQLESFTLPIKGRTVGILGFGGIGKATAKLLKPFGAKIIGINTSGKTNEDIDAIYTLDNLDEFLAQIDYLIITIPLNEKTKGLISKRELELMKPNAVLVNVARGAIINEKDLYEHLRANPEFYAAIDAWWVEPFGSGEFRLNYPFLDLPNVVGSPHNSSMVPNALIDGVAYACENIKSYIETGKADRLIKN